MDELVVVDDYRERIKVAYYEAVRRTSTNNTGRRNEIVSLIRDYVKAHYRDDIYLESIAGSMKMSANYLSHIFKETVGVSFSDYLGRYRVDMSKEALLFTDEMVGRVSRLVGYLNVNSYIRAFRKHEGVTPGRYRQIARASAWRRDTADAGEDRLSG